jgi:glycosyltransferase involved in cell wall biosynthesis
MIDILYLAFNRLEYTRQTTAAMLANTEWREVRSIHVYDDGSTDGTKEYLRSVKWPVLSELHSERSGGPVAVMSKFLQRETPMDIFAKIDNDTMLPPDWLTECLKVMQSCPDLGLLGIEAFCQVAAGRAKRSFVGVRHIGGIGLMRQRCFRTLPRPNGEMGRFGFTRWQHENAGVVKGWINPSLPVFLLDKCGFEPWAGLAQKYISAGWQRPWPLYTDEDKALWEWTGWR